MTRAPVAPRHTPGTEAAPEAVNFPPWLPVRVLCGPHAGRAPCYCEDIWHWHRVHRLLQLPDGARPTRGPHLPHPAQGGYTDAQWALSTSLGLTETTPYPTTWASGLTLTASGLARPHVAPKAPTGPMGHGIASPFSSSLTSQSQCCTPLKLTAFSGSHWVTLLSQGLTWPHWPPGLTYLKLSPYSPGSSPQS